MAEFDSSMEERTEPASQKKKDDTRRKGSVAKSMDLNSSAVIVFGLLALYVGGSAVAIRLGELARATFMNLAHLEVNTGSVHHFFKEGLFTFTTTIAPLLATLMVVGIVVNVAQAGFLFTFEPLMPKFKKLNPISGIKRVMFSRHSMMELLKGVFKVIIVAGVAYSATNDVLADSILLSDGDIAGILDFMAKISVTVGLKVGMAFFVLSAGDYIFQRFEYEKSLRMTKQEVKEEVKESEGDPQIKGRIKTIQRQIAYRRMMQDVPKADVVVTNPTHFAVAIKYEAGKMGAPRVVAKGTDLIAQRIKEIAKEHNVPILEDKPLAQMLYKMVEIGEEIPEKLFQAVAQVLAYVYRMRNSRRPTFSMN